MSQKKSKGKPNKVRHSGTKSSKSMVKQDDTWKVLAGVAVALILITIFLAWAS